jgi:putative nucleotidyltransferase with HDIG domain
MNDQPSGGDRGSPFNALRRGLRALRPGALKEDGRLLPAIFIIVFVIVSILLFPPTRKTREVAFNEGDIADVDVIAPLDFKVPLSGQEVEINRARAAVSVPPVYRLRPDALQNLPGDLTLLMERIKAVATVDSIPPEQRTQMIRDMVPALEREPVELLLDKRIRRKILDEGLDIQKRLLERGIINDASPLRRRDYPHISLIDGGSESLKPANGLLEQGQLESVILGRAERAFPGSDDAQKLFYAIVRSHLVPNMIYDAEETRQRQQSAMEEVQGVYDVSKNQRIIAKHDKVTKKQVVELEALEKSRTALELKTSPVMRIMLFIGKIVRILLLAGMFAAALYRFDRPLIKDMEKLTLTFMIIMSYLLMTALVIRLPFLSEYLVPVAFVSLVATAFFGSLTALIFTLFASLMLITHAELPGSLVFISILAGSAAIYSIAHLRERRNFYTIFLYSSLAYIIGITSFGISEAFGMSEFLFGSLWGIANAFACTILVMFLMPIFESLFSVTTNFTLMELSDLNRPLLKRLIIEAPGTYHHSLMVGNMVEAVASDVGANGLLARVSAYYHDIGKLSKPEYFFENKGENFNKHEKLAPTMSALILASHVKEGVDLARNEKMPKVVMDGIREHHGTTVMAFFYNKALEYDSHDSVNIDDFRYPGPRPQSKETALIMLADSCEAAVRSLKEPTAPRIRALVSKIFATRMNDGELDNSSLTLNDIAVIREKFIQFLTGIFHPRVQYPSQGETTGEVEHSVEDNGRQQQSVSDRKKRV